MNSPRVFDLRKALLLVLVISLTVEGFRSVIVIIVTFYLHGIGVWSLCLSTSELFFART